MPRPWLSILMPIYNGENYLRCALNSIFKQASKTDFEVIAVDDGSTDSSLSILEDFQQRLPLRIDRLSRVGNWVKVTNHALSIATGHYVCFLHQDDLWLEDRLLTVRNITSAWPTADLILQPTRFVDHRGRFVGLWRCPLPKDRLLSSSRVLERLTVQNFVAIVAPVFRREVALDSGGLDEGLWYTADWDLWLKIASRGPTICWPSPLSAFRLHPTSQTVVRSANLADFRSQFEAVHNRHLESWQATEKTRQAVSRAARFSMEVNVALAAASHGLPQDWLGIVAKGIEMGPSCLGRYIRDSRILERLLSRFRARSPI